MEVSGSGRREELFARQTERIGRELLDSGIPVFALASSSRPTEERFGGLELSDDKITAVHVVYEQPAPYGPWADVETSRWAGVRTVSESLRSALEHYVRLGGERFAELTWAEHPATLHLDGRSVTARLLRAGERWWAMRCAQDGVEITVVGRDWLPEAVALERMVDFAPMLDRLSSDSPAESRVPPEAPPLPEDFREEPHRALAETVLRNTAEQAAWRADGGSVPALPGHWTALWRAAVRRQMELSGQPEPVAKEAVGTMMSQLATLHHEAAWFRDDEDLRRRAVSEVLVHGTELGGDLPSRGAQDAWLRRAGRGWPAGDSDIRARAAADAEWSAAWQAWAADQRHS